MRVAELIEHLKQFDDRDLVYFSDCESGEFSIMTKPVFDRGRLFFHWPEDIDTNKTIEKIKRLKSVLREIQALASEA